MMARTSSQVLHRVSHEAYIKSLRLIQHTKNLQPVQRRFVSHLGMIPHAQNTTHGLSFSTTAQRRQQIQPIHPDLVGLDLSIGGNHPQLRAATNSPAGKVIENISFVPLMKGQGSDPIVLVLSKKPKSLTGYMTIEPFVGEVCEGETLFNASRRNLLNETGLSASKALDQSTALIYKAPISTSAHMRFMVIEVDMTSVQNQGIHPEDLYQLQGDSICVIRAPLSRLAQFLNQLASEGRVIDSRLHIFALGAETAYAAAQRDGGMSIVSKQLASAMGVMWLFASVLIGGAFIGHGFGWSVDIRSMQRVNQASDH